MAREKAVPESDYGKRKCMACGRVFVARKPWEVTCSPECRDARRKMLQNASNRKRWVKMGSLRRDIRLLAAIIAATCSDWEKAMRMVEDAGGLFSCELKPPVPEAAAPETAPAADADGKAEGTAPEEKAPEAPEAPLPIAEAAEETEKVESISPTPEDPAAEEAREPEKAPAADPEPASDVPSEPAPKPEAVPSPAPVQPPLDFRYCERMRLKSTVLPCGEREECFLSPRCENVPAGVTKMIRRCETCGAELGNARGGKRFCSTSCRMKASRMRKAAREAEDDSTLNIRSIEENL